MNYSIADKHNGYGIVSIALHWIAVIVIFSLWFIGDSIQADISREDRFELLQLHVSVAVFGYLIIGARIVWRVYQGHPRIDKQKKWTHLIARLVHYAILLLLSLMLITGPVMVLNSGTAFSIFGLFSISAVGINTDIYNLARLLHSYSATLIIILTTLHILGAFKHMMFNDDDLLIRMIFPVKKGKSD